MIKARIDHSYGVVSLVSLCAIVAFSLVLGLACPPITQADPIVDYPTGAPAGTAVYGLAPGAGGAMWFAESPTGEGNQFEVAEMSESGDVLTSAQLNTGGSTQGDTGVFATLVPASDGGVWVAGGGSEQLAHVSPDGSVQPVAMPSGRLLGDGVTAGQDGDAWGVTCNYIYSGQQVSESCEVLKIDNTEHVTPYPLPSFEHTFPEADLSSEEYETPPALALAVADGVWVDKPAVTEDGSIMWEAAFISYAGQVTPAAIPANARLIAPATGDSAWWQEPANVEVQKTSAVTFGQVTASGSSTPMLVHREQSAEPLAFATVDPGTGGSLLWSEATPGALSGTGFLGTISGNQETEYTVGPNQTAIPPPTPYGPEIWSGTCSFGAELYQAANGDIWVFSGGHPSRLSVLTPSSGFSTFLPVPSGAEEFQVWRMMQSSTGELWFSLDEPNVSSASATALLARANPLSPPPGEPAFPSLSPTTNYGTTDLGTSQGRGHASSTISLARLRASLLAQLVPSGKASSITGLLKHGGLTMSFEALEPGSLVIDWYQVPAGAKLAKAKRKPVLVASGRATFSAAGTETVKLKLTTAGKNLLKHASRLKLTAKATFTPSGKTAISTTKTFSLKGK